MPQYDIRLYSSQLLLCHEAILRINCDCLREPFLCLWASKETISVKPAVWQCVLVTIETDDRHFSSGSKLKYPFTAQFSFMMLFLMHKCLINNKKSNWFWSIMSPVTEQPQWLVCGRPMLCSTLINSLYRPKWPDEYMYIIMYIMRTNKFTIHTYFITYKLSDNKNPIHRRLLFRVYFWARL